VDYSSVFLMLCKARAVDSLLLILSVAKTLTVDVTILAEMVRQVPELQPVWISFLKQPQFWTAVDIDELYRQILLVEPLSHQFRELWDAGHRPSFSIISYLAEHKRIPKLISLITGDWKLENELDKGIKTFVLDPIGEVKQLNHQPALDIALVFHTEKVETIRFLINAGADLSAFDYAAVVHHLYKGTPAHIFGMDKQKLSEVLPKAMRFCDKAKVKRSCLSCLIFDMYSLDVLKSAPSEVEFTPARMLVYSSFAHALTCKVMDELFEDH